MSDTDGTAAPPDGDTFPEALAKRYRPERILGQGPMGSVWAAERISDGRKLAIKFLEPELARDSVFLARFRRERKLGGRRLHPGLVEFFEASKVESRHFLVMELIEGRSLHEVLAEQRPLPLRRVLEIAHALADCLAALHEAGIVHRDLKPENIMIEEGGCVRLLDLGLARDLGGDGLTRAGVIVGTPWYLAPEVCRGDRAGFPADIFALGVIMAECLSGASPLDRSHEAIVDLVTSRAAGQLTSTVPGGIDPHVAALLEGFTSLEPADRPADGAAAARAIEELLPQGALPSPASSQEPEHSASIPVLDENGPRRFDPSAPTILSGEPLRERVTPMEDDPLSRTKTSGRRLRRTRWVLLVALAATALVALAVYMAW